VLTANRFRLEKILWERGLFTPRFEGPRPRKLAARALEFAHKTR
jgi:hypothetical protein